MPIRRPSDLFAGSGSVAGKLKKRRKAIESGDASGGRSQKASAGDSNEEAIRKKRAERKRKEEEARKKRMKERKTKKAKRLRDALTSRGSS